MIRKGWLVSPCGCTDCFPDAVFFNEAMAYTYANRYCDDNPEGFVIKEIDVSCLNLRDD